MRGPNRLFNDAVTWAFAHTPFNRQLALALRPLPVPWRIKRMLKFTGPITIDIDAQHSFRMFATGRIAYLLFWRGFEGGWESTSLRVWASLVHGAPVILDVGSNVGVYALTAKSLNPTATVVAFEPYPPAFERLAANVELNGFDVFTSDLAVSHQDGNAAFYPHTREQLASLETGDGDVTETREQITVRTTRLDDFAAAHGLRQVDLIKIDIEGHEPKALEGAQRTLAASRPTLLVEVLTGDVADELWARLEPLGYEAYRIYEQRGLVRLAEPGGRSWQARNCLFCPKGTIERHGLTSLVLNAKPDETRPRRFRQRAPSRYLPPAGEKPLVGEVSSKDHG